MNKQIVQKNIFFQKDANKKQIINERLFTDFHIFVALH